MKALALLFVFVSGAALTRAWDATHIDPILIGGSIPGVPCQVSDDHWLKDCRIVGAVRNFWLPSRLEALDGSWTIGQSLPVGYHAAPPPRKSPGV